jgi:hypothetical protein
VLTYLSEDPWPLVWTFGLAAMGFLIALWMTQQGKYLIRAGIALALALLVLGIEYVWVTDNERIERVVYDLAQAVADSDAERALSHLAPEVEVTPRSGRSGMPLPPGLVRATLRQTQFDFLRVMQLTTNAGTLSRRGTAEFKVFASAAFINPSSNIQFNYATPPSGMQWSLGFREVEPKVWKVTRITAVNPPRGFRWPVEMPMD